MLFQLVIPNIFSTAQRIAQGQAILQMASANPQLYDMYEANKRMLEAVRINNIDEILKKPQEASRLDPIDENMSVMYGKPIRAFPEQDHESYSSSYAIYTRPIIRWKSGCKSINTNINCTYSRTYCLIVSSKKMQSSINMTLPTYLILEILSLNLMTLIHN